MSDERRRELGARVYAHIVSSMGLGKQGTAYLESRGLSPATCRLLGVRSVGIRQWEWVMTQALDRFGPRVLSAFGLGRRGPGGDFLPHPHGRSPMLVFGYGGAHAMCGLRFRLLGRASRGPRYLSLRARAGRLPTPTSLIRAFARRLARSPGACSW